MSRAGRRARRERLIASGQWTPSACIERTEDDRRAAIIAEHAAWIREVGVLGWQREQDQRRAERLKRYRNQRKGTA